MPAAPSSFDLPFTPEADAAEPEAVVAGADPVLPAVEIYTDGACKGNPGPGGWGALVIDGSGEHELYGGEPATTNNRMELQAVIQALKSLPPATVANVHTDSQYVQQGISQWIHNWKRRGWRTADGKPVKNVDLWQELDREQGRHRVAWRWVRGHAGDPGNERADALANRGIGEAARAGRAGSAAGSA